MPATCLMPLRARRTERSTSRLTRAASSVGLSGFAIGRSSLLFELVLQFPDPAFERRDPFGQALDVAAGRQVPEVPRLAQGALGPLLGLGLQALHRRGHVGEL